MDDDLIDHDDAVIAALNQMTVRELGILTDLIEQPSLIDAHDSSVRRRLRQLSVDSLLDLWLAIRALVSRHEIRDAIAQWPRHPCPSGCGAVIVCGGYCTRCSRLDIEAGCTSW